MFITTLITVTQALTATIFSILAIALITGVAPAALAKQLTRAHRQKA
jgi:hypothetical protein